MLALLQTLSRGIYRVEIAALVALAAGVTGLILLNVVTRSLDFAIYWVDELAIYAMIWLVMIGASVTVRTRKGIAVTLADAFLSERVNTVLKWIVDVLVLGFALFLIWAAWIWYDPIGLIRAGLDTDAFTQSTFNFIYQEPTLTIGVPKYWVWMVMPVTALAMSVHAMTNIAERIAGTSDPAIAGEAG